MVIAGVYGLRKGNMNMSRRGLGGMGGLSAWLGTWWGWFWSWFSSEGKIKLDEKV